MADRVHLGRIGEDAAGLVAPHGVVFPALLPELVDDVQVFVGQVVALVMRQLLRQAEIARGAVQIAGDDVPAEAALRQMVERGDAAREGIRVLIGQRAGDAEAQVLGHAGHQRHERQRIVQRRLHAMPERRISRALEHVIHAQHVGQEDTVETATLQQPRQVLPIGRIGVAVRLVARVRPQARGLMPHGVHREGVEPDLLVLLAHWRKSGRA